MKKPGDPAPVTAVVEGGERAKLGEKPGAAAARVATITATIAAIDRSTMIVTLRGPDGELTSVKARDPKKLDRVSVGDQVEITYTEALGISVEAPKK